MRSDRPVYLVAGLGNIGARYAATYHNLGFMAADAAAARLDVAFKKRKYLATAAEGKAAGRRFFLIKPETYMNLSGDAVKGWMTALGVPLENLLVVYDDIDIECGRLRLRAAGSAGSHNGMRHIVACLGTDRFMRLRIGAGPAPEGRDLADYVLSNISRERAETVRPAVERAAEAVECFVGGMAFDELGRRFNG